MEFLVPFALGCVVGGFVCVCVMALVAGVTYGAAPCGHCGQNSAGLTPPKRGVR